MKTFTHLNHYFCHFPLSRFHFIALGLCLSIWLVGCKKKQENITPATPNPGHTSNVSKKFMASNLLPSQAVSGSTMDVEPIDIDKDGDLDLIIANEFLRNIILLNDGTGKFSDGTESRIPNVNRDSEDIALADFDQDGDIDIVFVTEDDFINEYYWNNGNGTFSEAAFPLPITQTSNAVLATDLDNDGDMDLLVGNTGQNRALINDGKGKFTDATTQFLPSANYTTQDLELGDVDGDGDLDLIEGNEDGNQLLINNGQGVFTYETSSRLPLSKLLIETREVDFGDVDGDGDLDLVFGNVNFSQNKNAQNRILINNGQGFFTDETDARLPANILNTVDVDLVDIDQDNDLDLIAGNAFGTIGIQIFINNGQGVFEDKTNELAQAGQESVIDVEVADFNGDQKPDIYIGVFQGPDRLLIQQD